MLYSWGTSRRAGSKVRHRVDYSLVTHCTRYNVYDIIYTRYVRSVKLQSRAAVFVVRIYEKQDEYKRYEYNRTVTRGYAGVCLAVKYQALIRSAR